MSDEFGDSPMDRYMAAEVAKHRQAEQEYAGAARLFRYRVRILQAPGDRGWVYLANSVEVRPEPGLPESGMYKLVLRDAWTGAEAERCLEEVEMVCCAYTVERFGERDLSPEALLQAAEEE